MTENWEEAGFGLYLHWPFCQAKCPYCDFNSHVVDTIDQARWQRAYLAEIDRYADETPGRLLSTVFFGGGTPSLMSPDLVAAVIERIRARWPMVNDPEITLEANPTSVEASRFAGYRDAGVTRVSLGVQALNDADLKRLGRLHSAGEARAAFDLARAAFERVSFDLIYARQHQTVDHWSAELAEALQMAVEHLSLYQLTIEPGTAFGARAAAGGLKGLPSDDLGADLWDVTQELCEKSGFRAYEVSNHAKQGSESRHNLVYWRSGDWVGIGPGAHGRLTFGDTRLATETGLQPIEWLRAVETTGCGESLRQPLTLTERGSEYLVMGLRLVEGVSLSRYETMAGKPLNMNKIKDLEHIGLLRLSGDRVQATAAGRPVLNALLRELVE